VAYQDEESIKAELRELTKATRKVREELDGLVRSGAAKDLTRGLLHVSGKVTLDPPAVTADRPRKRRRTKP